MRFDQARVAIRERSWLENLDLALHVARVHGKALLACAVIGILPFAFVNHVITHPGLPLGRPRDPEAAIYLTIVLSLIEAPFATALMTLYLGAALFDDRPHPMQLARMFAASLPQMILLQGVLRAILLAPVVTAFVPFVMWPYLNEVILLERNPLAGGDGATTLRRNAWLHRGNRGDYLLRALAATVVGGLLTLALAGSLYVILTVIFGIDPEVDLMHAVLQASLWVVIGFLTIARFLQYLDQRIRNEGWEVELQLRTQRDRLASGVI
ncbi:MAG TPA: hypothetical protein VL175_12335 [Pirellulales bacterium]|jgi:hypothetical protein|nr:hypothetical protein [Pirellulales bacterium]